MIHFGINYTKHKPVIIRTIYFVFANMINAIEMCINIFLNL